MENRWNTYTTYLNNKYGHGVYRIGIDGGFSCPNREGDRSGGCSFCDGTGASPTYYRTKEGKWKRSSIFQRNVALKGPRKVEPLDLRLDSIEKQVERGMSFIKRRYNVDYYSIYFQAWTSTYASVEELKKLYDKALSLYKFTEFIISTRPDSLDDEIIELIASYKNKVSDVWVEVGLQSSNNSTLERIKRGHTSEDYVKAVNSLHERGIKVSTHIITGLPGESREDLRATVKLINSVGSEGIKIHNLDILGGTQFFDEYMLGEISVPSNDRAIEDCMFIIRRLRPDMIVQRIICESPSHRLAAPRNFFDKSKIIQLLNEQMEEYNAFQGDLYEFERI
ncbi:MAG: TIGR01212 family radical SAM protein [Spirochaetaceae bacterium]|nr:TIGR01212 family radical SAM protein [Spirochaetaceae bacterium]